MAVKMRLKRMGQKKAPFYRVVVADARSPRDGRFIEEIGTYDPNQDPSVIKFDEEAAKKWLAIENPTEVELAQIEQTHKTKVISWIESFYEMVFSSTSVLIFLSLYYVLDERIPQAAYFWNKYQDILLMVFLVCSVFLTFWFDRIFVHLKTISSEQKASVRLISAFYIILILLYIKFIYNDSNYDSLIFYFVMLAIGRFVYFDSTLDYIKESLKSVVKYLPLLILMGAYSGFICWYGFSSDFLLKSNGVIVSTLLAHLFMDVAIFVLNKIRVVQFIGKF